MNKAELLSQIIKKLIETHCPNAFGLKRSNCTRVTCDDCWREALKEVEE